MADMEEDEGEYEFETDAEEKKKGLTEEKIKQRLEKER